MPLRRKKTNQQGTSGYLKSKKSTVRGLNNALDISKPRKKKTVVKKTRVKY